MSVALPIIPVILCGGAGSRLWPLSRTHSPKQFLPLAHPEYTLFQQTLQRVQSLDVPEIVVVSNNEQRFAVAANLQEIGGSATILLEPEGRNTAAAIAAAALYVQEKHGDALLLVLPSDHIIQDAPAFLAAVTVAARTAERGYAVTFGITPDYAETGYGYIKKASEVEGVGAYEVAQFVEKPDAVTAQAYVASGEYAWNSGMFMFQASLFCAELSAFHPEIMQAVGQSVQHSVRDADFVRLEAEAFKQSPNIAVDVAVMEKTRRAAVVPLSCGWSDAGAWDALWRVQEKDENGNVQRGVVITQDAHNNYFYAMEHAPAIAAVGIEGLAVISTPDMVLVASQAHAQQVKALLAKATSVQATWGELHTQVARPWGDYQVLFPATPQATTPSSCKVKHIHVNAGERLSVQMHHHRAEHWVIVQGKARVVVGEEEHLLTQGGYVFIPQGAVHYIENIGEESLYFIEVQTGNYLGEDDIVRFNDKYGRA